MICAEIPAFSVQFSISVDKITTYSVCDSQVVPVFTCGPNSSPAPIPLDLWYEPTPLRLPPSHPCSLSPSQIRRPVIPRISPYPKPTWLVHSF